MPRNVTPNGYGLGWRKQLPDPRDYVFAAHEEVLETLPAYVDMRPQCPPVYDQGNLGSCTANAIAGALEFDQKKQAFEEFTPSRLMIYYDERAMEGTVNSDAGAEIRDGIKSVATQGACPESEWPYVISNFAQKPPSICYTDGVKYEALQYQAIQQDINQLKACLASGFPFVYGFVVYESFESREVANTGVVPMPSPGEQQLGGHAVMAVGYDDGQQRFIARNSWGTNWGQQGYFTVPYQYLTSTKLSSDFWSVSLVSSPSPSPGPSPGPTPPPPGPSPGPYYPGVERVSLGQYQRGAYAREVVVTRNGTEVAHSEPK